MNHAMPVLSLGAILLGASSLAFADAPRTYCGESMVQGTYGIHMQGTRPGAGGASEAVIGVVVRYYDGRGNVMQSDNIKGVTTGYTPNRYGTGTYHVNDDCTVDIVFQPTPGITLQERGVILDGGNEIRTITVLPAPFMVTAIHRRI